MHWSYNGRYRLLQVGRSEVAFFRIRPRIICLTHKRLTEPTKQHFSISRLGKHPACLEIDRCDLWYAVYQLAFYRYPHATPRNTMRRLCLRFSMPLLRDFDSVLKGNGAQFLGFHGALRLLMRLKHRILNRRGNDFSANSKHGAAPEMWPSKDQGFFTM